jgi:hypothetical protein
MRIYLTLLLQNRESVNSAETRATSISPCEGVEKVAKRLAHPPPMRLRRIGDPFPRRGKGHDVTDVLCGGYAAAQNISKT